MTSRKDQEGEMIRNRKFDIPYSFLVLLLLAGALLFLASGEVVAYYNSKYTESAHGNSTYGVNRSGLSGYSVGNCAHCHDQHASIDGSSHTAYDFGLFAPNNPTSQTDNFCFQCHDSASSVQAVTNYSYSKTFGGGSSTTPDDIKDAFNLAGDYASSHNLADVQSHIISKGIGFTSDENACCTCHDPHIAQKNSPVVYTGRGGVKTAVRTLSCYQLRPTNLYGDEDAATSGFNERVRDAVGKYKAPYQVGKTTYEPDGLGSAPAGGWGSNMPNYKAVCFLKCHGTTGVSSTEHGTLQQIDWGTNGDSHGKSIASGTGGGYTIAPYGTETYNYYLTCTDCHEPHGSPNPWLLRTCVNGKDNIIMGVAGDGTYKGFWYEFCTACHVLTAWTTSFHKEPPNAAPECESCHRHSYSVGL